MDEAAPLSPVATARFAGACYLVVVVLSIYSYVIAPDTGLGHASGLVASTANLVVTLLLYQLLRPVSPGIALLAVFFNLEGSAHAQDPLAFFGCFCLCTGYLVHRSTFLPRIIGLAMALAGLGLLTNAYAPLLFAGLPRVVSSVAFTFDGIGEISLALWLATMGVDARRWHAVHRPESSGGKVLL